MLELAVLLLQPDAVERGRCQAALAACCGAERVAAVASVAEAVQALGLAGGAAAKLPRLLLVDLPAEEGLPLMARLRSHPATAGIPVVALLAGTDRRLQEAWYRAGANSVVGHTRDDRELAEKMRRVVAYWTTVNLANRASRL